VREAYPDPTVEPGEKGEWSCVDMRAIAPLPRPVTLAELKADPAFTDLPLIRQSRLSVVPVSDEHWALIQKMSAGK